jgi:hypothetical protein
MRTRSLIAVTALLFISAIVVAPPPAAAGGGTTIVQVTTTDDELDPGQVVPGPDVSLREAIAFGNAEGLGNDQVVQLQPGATYALDVCGPLDDTNATGDLDVTISLSFTLDGNGATVRQTCDGAGVLHKPTGPSQLVVDETTIAGGEGGGVTAEPDVRIRNGSVIEGNRATTAGGGVQSSNDVFVEDSTVRNNVAGTPGGGVFALATMEVTNSTITGNLAGTSGGGAFAHGTLLVSNSTVAHNRSTTGGGGIGSFQPITVVRSTISDNDAAGAGGAILAFDDVLVATSTLARNGAATIGGGIDNVGADDPTTITASTLVANAAPIGANLHTEFSTTIARSIVSMGSGGEDCALDGGGNLPILVGGDASCYGILQPIDELSLHPMVAPPADNGGPTETQRTVGPSRAVDVFGADMGGCADGRDQRGVARPQGPLCDVGAFEAVPLACTSTFGDVSTGHPFFEEICWLSQMGITGGFADGGYHPSAAVSRQAMAAFLYRLALTPPFQPPTTPTFDDVGPSHPFLREVEWLASEQIAGGFEDDTYRPLSPVSRQAMAAFLYRVGGEPPAATPPAQTFGDVPPSHPFFDEIAWMTEAGVANGFEDDTFRPSNPVSRQAMAAFLLRLADDVPLLGL